MLDNGTPILTIITFLPIVGAFFVVLSTRRWAKIISLLATLATFAFSLIPMAFFDKSTADMQFIESHTWLPFWDINYKVGVDGISLLFVLLATLLSVLCVMVSWRSIRQHDKLFFVSLLTTETAMIGVFVSLNFFLFYLFWELMLIPMFLIIGVWGGANRIYAAIKFVLFTLAGSVLMLIGMVVLYHSGGHTFDIIALSRVVYPEKLQFWLFLAFFAAFAVKVPMFPAHTWLPDAHSEAPTAGSVILAGVLLKMGAYGFLRFSIPMFPHAVERFLDPLLYLSITAIIYGAYVTLMQTDIKRLIAYSSVSHMGFVTLGIFTLNQSGVEGGILQMINHGIVTGALFLCVGMMYERTHTRMIIDYGGLFSRVPRFSVCFAVFCLAAIGLPGLNSFVGEFLILAGAFRTQLVLGALAIVGVILGTVYMAWLYYRVILNEVKPQMKSLLSDLNIRELALLIPLLLLVFLLGVIPETLLAYLHESVSNLLQQASISQMQTASNSIELVTPVLSHP